MILSVLRPRIADSAAPRSDAEAVVKFLENG